VTRIVEKAFSGCSDLTDVYCYIENLSNVDVDSWAFVNSYLEYTTLHVPKASLEAYKKNEPWRGFGKIVPIERSVGTESYDVKSISGKKLGTVKENIKFKIESESNVETTESEILTLKSIVENTSEYAESNSKVFDVVEQMPSFPGGPSAMIQYLSKNQQYPVDAEKNGIQGRVIVTFVVECDGSITNVRVVKSVDPSLDKEALRVVKSMPLWIPGKQNGSAVRVKYTVPVTFRLQ
jgi:TonB family protein